MQCQNLVANPDDIAAFGAADLVALDALDAKDIAGRNGEQRGAAFDDQTQGRGHAEREVQREPCSLPRHAGDVDVAAQALDMVAHDIQPHAAPRDVGHFRPRRHARPENEPQQVVLAHALGLGALNDAALNGAGAHRGAVDAPPVILHLDDDGTAALRRTDRNMALGALAGRDPFFRRLDAVVDAVAQQMGERRLDLLQHGAIYLGVAPRDRQVHLFVQLVSQIAYHAREALQHAADGHEARAEHIFLQVIDQLRFVAPAGLHVAVQPAQVGRHGAKRSRGGVMVRMLHPAGAWPPGRALLSHFCKCLLDLVDKGGKPAHV